MSTPNFAALIREITTDDDAPADSDTDARMLDATLYLVGELGERRVTIDDVAEGSRVARSTVFRRFGSKDALLQRLYEREVRRAVHLMLTTAHEAPDVASAAADVYARLVAYVAEHPVTKRQARVEPDVFVRLWRDGESSGLQMIATLIGELVLRREDARDMDRDAVAGLCDVLARLLFAELLIPDPTARQERRAREVRALVEAWLQEPARAR